MNKLWKRGSVTAAGILAVAIFAMANYLAYRHHTRWDWTSAQVYTLSEKSIKIVERLEKPVTVTVFFSSMHPLYGKVKELLGRYQAVSGGKITVEELDAERQPKRAEELVRKLGISSDNSIVFASGADKRYVEERDLAEYDYSPMQFQEPPLLTKFKAEEAFTSALLDLTEQETPRLLFVTGHGERGLESRERNGLFAFKAALARQNYSVEEWRSLGAGDVPHGVAAAIIAGPTVPFTEPEIAVLDAYLNRGGRLLVLADPSLQTGRDPGSEASFQQFLENWGVKLGNDIVIDPSNSLPGYGLETVFVTAYGSHPIVSQMEGIPTIYPLARSVMPGTPQMSELVASGLAFTAAAGWGETGLASSGRVSLDAGDLRGPVTLALAVGPPDHRAAAANEDMEDSSASSSAPQKKDSSKLPRLVVVGDADFVSNGQFENAGNFNLAVNAVDWLAAREALIGIASKAPEQVSLSLSSHQLWNIFILALLVLPACAVLVGVVVWFRRRD